jgi:ankyrin repeat protein
MQSAWGRVLAGKQSEQDAQTLRDLFPGNICLEELDLTSLHKSVLSIIDIDASVMLKKSDVKSQINSQDAWLRTPLHWAAEREDVRAVETLLLHGAEVNQRDYLHETALLKAARTGNIQSTKCLLLAGANTHLENKWGETCVHHASQHSVLLLQTILERSSIDVKNNPDLLRWSAWANNVEVGRYLIDTGMDINASDPDGNTPVFGAISSLSHEFFELLIKSSRLDLNHVNRNSCNILHWVARFGDRRMVDIMSAANLAGIDTTVRDQNGRTAVEMLHDRIRTPEGMPAALQQLLLQLEEDHEVFFDALEA